MRYEQLVCIAKEKLLSVNTVPEHLSAPLVYVLETAGGNIQTVINDGFQDIIDLLAQEKDTVIMKLVSMWKDGTVDVPSYAFRNALLELNTRNAQTRVLLRTEGGYTEKPIEIMMPPLKKR